MFLSFISFLYTLIDFYPGLLERYIEAIYLNVNLWANSAKEVQRGLIASLEGKLKIVLDTCKSSKVIDIFLNAIEMYVDKMERVPAQPEEDKILLMLSDVVMNMLKNNISEENISKLKL